MGWTGLHRDKGMSNDDFFRAEFPTMLGERGEILASATVRGTYYAAVKQHDTGEVWALVVLTRWSRGYFNFTYKDMSESMGPSEANCPTKVLSLLTSTDDEYANEWRADCRANLARQEAAKKITKGTTVRFARPLEFTNGDNLDTFTFEGRNTFSHPERSARYSISNWKDRRFEVVCCDCVR